MATNVSKDAAKYLQQLHANGWKPSVEVQVVGEHRTGDAPNTHLHADAQTFIQEQLAQRYEIEDITETADFISSTTPEPRPEPESEPILGPTSEPLPEPQADSLFLLRAGRQYFYGFKADRPVFIHDVKRAQQLPESQARTIEYHLEIEHGHSIDLVPLEAL